MLGLQCVLDSEHEYLSWYRKAYMNTVINHDTGKHTWIP